MSQNIVFNHSNPIQVRFSDIDSLGHATNSAYQNFFDLGRMEYFLKVFEEPMNWQTKGLILVDIHISYLAPIKLYDKIGVKTKVVKMGNKSLEMIQQVYSYSNNTIVAESKSIMVGFSGKQEKSIPIPNRWREKIINFESDIDFC